MLSSEDKSNDTEANEQQVLSNIPISLEQESDRQQIFQLIDHLLSFEACLYHQILPFRLEGNKLLLGMVHPQDSSALDYVNRILAYINCTMVAQEIASDSHRHILSAYLNYKNTFSSNIPALNHVDFKSSQQQPPKSMVANMETPKNPSNLTEFPSLPEPNLSALAQKLKQEITEATLANNLTILPVPTPELSTPVEVLALLPPKKLLEELLGRVLGGGIGRLYLERQPYQGRILWSDNGVVQSVLDNLPLSVFQGVLNELKRFAGLPVATITEPKQIEKECLYQQNRLLLRLRVMPGIYGEEATLQVLRGAALKFYQQQHLARLSRDVLGISQQLSYKLQELHQRLILNSSLTSEQADALDNLNHIVENLDQQVKILTANSDSMSK
ncbi:type II secretory pathway, ATPase PulE/Tfp pilus assembly pathway, ATPase PilB [Nostoc piscinale CENA21]|uniref:Type II secretory pathway, ATPase PulE/Tfp pilus assembly pathway, ATPase PilB n=1 Tax=Nostoc piscinale CENA21 TaxID=224013 RepID=A0A0M5MG70_9NOSO|nr:pilus assembly protein PilB [Nostoc piscinale]ALF51988.1 type II secretory pathway, ATPase PulE/Tfp pilus assembly pathway, ATPase PilB [Nostoc piscinale CENA21]